MSVPMPVTVPVLAQDISTPPAIVPEAATTSFDERWAAWLARGAAHDRAVRRKIAIAAPILALVVGVLYVLLFR
jgi:hypothetical protein